MHRSLFYFVLVWHLTCMLAYNVSSTVRGYRQLTEESGSGYFHCIQRAATALTSWSPIHRFSQYAGTATGYGFFAPQVGSSFLLKVTAVDTTDTAQATAHMPVLKQGHSVLRYHSLLNRMQNLLREDTGGGDESALPLRQARAIAHCLTQRIARQRWGKTAYRTRCEIFVYDYPALRQLDAVPRGRRLSIYQKTI